MIVANIILIVLNLYLILKKQRVEYYKEGIRIRNKSKEVVIEYDKPLKK